MLKEKIYRPELRFFLFLIVLLFLAAPLCFSQGYTFKESGTEPSVNLGNFGIILENIFWFFKSGYMKTICGIALGGLGIGVLMNRGEPGMVKKFIPWIAGVTIVISLSSITTLVFGS
jgi:hypothetical protein